MFTLLDEGGGVDTVARVVKADQEEGTVGDLGEG